MKLFVCAFALCLMSISAAQSGDITESVAPSIEYLPPNSDAETAKLAGDGYQYKTVRRFRQRHRREVSTQEYLPPVAEPSVEYLPPVESAATKVADDGYRYKSVRKLKFRTRHRRDVSEIAEPVNEYLPPVHVELAPELKDVLAADGYRYRTVRRLKYRRHRREVDAPADASADEAIVPVAKYLPPAVAPVAVEEEVAVAEPKSAELAQDGYRYKTVRRTRYRYRS